MGLAHTTLYLKNPVKHNVEPIKTKALADTGAVHLCIPAHIAYLLDLKELEKREVTLADGSKCFLPYVGPIEVKFANRRCFVGAMVMGNEVLLGTIPMDDMDLVVCPLSQDVYYKNQATNPKTNGPICEIG